MNRKLTLSIYEFLDPSISDKIQNCEILNLTFVDKRLFTKSAMNLTKMRKIYDNLYYEFKINSIEKLKYIEFIDNPDIVENLILVNLNHLIINLVNLNNFGGVLELGNNLYYLKKITFSNPKLKINNIKILDKKKKSLIFRSNDSNPVNSDNDLAHISKYITHIEGNFSNFNFLSNYSNLRSINIKILNKQNEFKIQGILPNLTELKLNLPYINWINLEECELPKLNILFITSNAKLNPFSFPKLEFFQFNLNIEDLNLIGFKFPSLKNLFIGNSSITSLNCDYQFSKLKFLTISGRDNTKILKVFLKFKDTNPKLNLDIKYKNNTCLSYDFKNVLDENNLLSYKKIYPPVMSLVI